MQGIGIYILSLACGGEKDDKLYSVHIDRLSNNFRFER